MFIICEDSSILAEDVEKYSFFDKHGNERYKSKDSEEIWYVFRIESFENACGVDILQLVSEKKFLLNKRALNFLLAWSSQISIILMFIFASSNQAIASDGLKIRENYNDLQRQTTIIKDTINDCSELIDEKNRRDAIRLFTSFQIEQVLKKNMIENVKSLKIKPLKLTPFINTLPNKVNLNQLGTYKNAFKVLTFVNTQMEPGKIVSFFPRYFSNSSYIKFILISTVIGNILNFVSHQVEIFNEKRSKKSSPLVKSDRLKIEKIVTLRGGEIEESYDLLNNLIENYWNPISFQFVPLSSVYILSHYLTTFFFNVENFLLTNDKEKVTLTYEERRAKVANWIRHHGVIFAIVIACVLIAVLYRQLMMQAFAFGVRQILHISNCIFDYKEVQDKKSAHTIAFLKDEIRQLLKVVFECQTQHDVCLDNVDDLINLYKGSENQLTECNNSLRNK